MRGYPKHLNSKADYEYVKAHFDEEKWKAAYEALLTTQYMWKVTEKLDTSEDGVTDDFHKVEEMEKEDGTIEYWQFEKVTNPQGKIFRIGYTVEEVEKILAA